MAQTILNGAQKLPELLSGRKTMLVCGRSFDKLPFSGEITALAAVCFRGFTPNPRYEEVCEGVRRFRESGCDTILAVGGGSAMDVAKCIKLFSAMDTDCFFLQQAFRDSGVLLIAVPTTAGTGSESTRHAVIYYQGEKQSVSHDSLVPDYAFLVPEVLEDLPLYQKKCTILDALCQAIESFWSVYSTPESKAYSLQAIDHIRDNWQDYIGHNRAFEAIMLAANLSGRAINITATTAPHAMSYKLTSLYGIPHGHAVALCLHLVWEYMQAHTEDCADSRGREYLAEMFRSLPVDPAWFRNLLNTLGMESPESQNREQDLEILTDSVNPARLERDTLRALYERILR